MMDGHYHSQGNGGRDAGRISRALFLTVNKDVIDGT
jgi:hypothetical protein